MSEVIDLIFFQILPWLIVILGLVGNVVSFLMFSRKKLHSISVHIYFRVMAACDTFNLVFFINNLVSDIFGKDFHNISVETCKITAYLGFMMPCLSAFILVLLSVDRFICVLYPNSLWFRKPQVQISLLTFVFTYNIGFYITTALVHTLHLKADIDTSSHFLPFHPKKIKSTQQCVCIYEKPCRIIKIIDVFSFFFLLIIIFNF